jgi:ABC-type bacteriocin/lantibiotic exporter with double-glycine peptidase domain
VGGVMSLLDAFPSVLQRDHHDCGTACAVAVCRFYGLRISVGECLTSLHTNELDGTDPRTMEAFFRTRGLRVLSGEMDTEDLKCQTGRGRPVVCVVAGHYVVALAVKRGRVCVHDPLHGRAAHPADVFGERWRDRDRLGGVYERFGLSVWRE